MPLLWTLVYIRARPVVAKLSYIRWWGEIRLPSSSLLRLLVVFIRHLINFYASFRTSKEPPDLQACHVFQCRPRFRNGSMPPPDPLLGGPPPLEI